MDWTDDGIVLSAKKHGETSSIVSLLTRNHGRHLGLVRGGTGKKTRGVLQPGNRISGPAIIDQLDTTTLIYPGDTARVDGARNLIIELATP